MVNQRDMTNHDSPTHNSHHSHRRAHGRRIIRPSERPSLGMGGSGAAVTAATHHVRPGAGSVGNHVYVDGVRSNSREKTNRSTQPQPPPYTIQETIQIYTDWANHYLSKVNSPSKIVDLQRDIRDGVLLAEVIEAVTSHKIEGITPNPRNAAHMIDNVNACLHLLGRLGVSLQDLSAIEIKEGNLKSILSLFFNLSRYKQQLKQETMRTFSHSEGSKLPASSGLRPPSSSKRVISTPPVTSDRRPLSSNGGGNTPQMTSAAVSRRPSDRRPMAPPPTQQHSVAKVRPVSPSNHIIHSTGLIPPGSKIATVHRNGLSGRRGTPDSSSPYASLTPSTGTSGISSGHSSASSGIRSGLPPPSSLPRGSPVADRPRMATTAGTAKSSKTSGLSKLGVFKPVAGRTVSLGSGSESGDASTCTVGSSSSGVPKLTSGSLKKPSIPLSVLKGKKDESGKKSSATSTSSGGIPSSGIPSSGIPRSGMTSRSRTPSKENLASKRVNAPLSVDDQKVLSQAVARLKDSRDSGGSESSPAHHGATGSNSNASPAVSSFHTPSHYSSSENGKSGGHSHGAYSHQKSNGAVHPQTQTHPHTVAAPSALVDPAAAPGQSLTHLPPKSAQTRAISAQAQPHKLQNHVGAGSGLVRPLEHGTAPNLLTTFGGAASSESSGQLLAHENKLAQQKGDGMTSAASRKAGIIPPKSLSGVYRSKYGSTCVSNRAEGTSQPESSALLKLAAQVSKGEPADSANNVASSCNMLHKEAGNQTSGSVGNSPTDFSAPTPSTGTQPSATAPSGGAGDAGGSSKLVRISPVSKASEAKISTVSSVTGRERIAPKDDTSRETCGKFASPYQHPNGAAVTAAAVTGRNGPTGLFQAASSLKNREAPQTSTPSCLPVQQQQRKDGGGVTAVPTLSVAPPTPTSSAAAAALDTLSLSGIKAMEPLDKLASHEFLQKLGRPGSTPFDQPPSGMTSHLTGTTSPSPFSRFGVMHRSFHSRPSVVKNGCEPTISSGNPGLADDTDNDDAFSGYVSDGAALRSSAAGSGGRGGTAADGGESCGHYEDFSGYLSEGGASMYARRMQQKFREGLVNTTSISSRERSVGDGQADDTAYGRQRRVGSIDDDDDDGNDSLDEVSSVGSGDLSDAVGDYLTGGYGCKNAVNNELSSGGHGQVLSRQPSDVKSTSGYISNSGSLTKNTNHLANVGGGPVTSVQDIADAGDPRGAREIPGSQDANTGMMRSFSRNASGYQSDGGYHYAALREQQRAKGLISSKTQQSLAASARLPSNPSQQHAHHQQQQQQQMSVSGAGGSQQYMAPAGMYPAQQHPQHGTPQEELYRHNTLGRSRGSSSANKPPSGYQHHHQYHSPSPVQQHVMANGMRGSSAGATEELSPHARHQPQNYVPLEYGPGGVNGGGIRLKAADTFATAGPRAHSASPLGSTRTSLSAPPENSAASSPPKMSIEAKIRQARALSQSGAGVQRGSSSSTPHSSGVYGSSDGGRGRGSSYSNQSGDEDQANMHGSMHSVGSSSSVYSAVADERHACEIRLLRKELEKAHLKVNTLSNHLNSNAQVVQAFEQSLANMTMRLHHLSSSSDQKDSELHELRSTIDHLQQMTRQAQIQNNAIIPQQGVRRMSSTSAGSGGSAGSSGTGGSNGMVMGGGSMNPSMASGMNRQMSSESLASMSSVFSTQTGMSTSSADMMRGGKKKKNWLRSSFSRAFSRGGSSKKGSDDGDLSGYMSDSTLMTGPQSHPAMSAPTSPMHSLPGTSQRLMHPRPSLGNSHEVEVVGDLRRQLREKDMQLTDIRLDALSSTHELDQMREAVMKMKSEMTTLKTDNNRLQRLVSETGLNPSSGHQSVSSSSSLYGGDSSGNAMSSSGSMTVGLSSPPPAIPPMRDLFERPRLFEKDSGAGLDFLNRDSDLVDGKRVTVSVGSSDAPGIYVGSVSISGKTKWDTLDSLVKRTFKQYLARIDPATNLGLTADSIHAFVVGEVLRMCQGSSLPELLPYGYLVGDTTNIQIILRGAAQGSVDMLAFECGIPKVIIQRYVTLLLDHRRIILSGPTGTGKSHLAQKLADHIVTRTGRKSPRSVSTFSVATDESSNALKQHVSNISTVCEKSAPVEGELPTVAIFDNLHLVENLKDVFAGFVHHKNPHCPYIIGTMNRTANATSDLQVHHSFRWVLISNQIEPVKGLLARLLQRRLVETESTRGGSPASNDLSTTLDWLPKVWQHTNKFLESQGCSDSTVGPAWFLSCPMSLDSAHAWFVTLWNDKLIPHIIESVKKFAKAQEDMEIKWADPTQWVAESFPWPSAKSDLTSSSLRHLTASDVGLDEKESVTSPIGVKDKGVKATLAMSDNSDVMMSIIAQLREVGNDDVSTNGVPGVINT